MLKNLLWKPDFAEAVERLEAWWDGRVLDRPPITLYVRARNPYNGPKSLHSSLRDRWLDVEYNVDCAIADLERRVYLAETLPVLFPNIGPCLTGTIFGCPLEFSEETSWAVHPVKDPSQWREIVEKPFDFENVYWKTIEQMTDLALERNEGRFLVGLADLHGNYDILESLRGSDSLCLDMIDSPETVQSAAWHAVEGYLEGYERLYRKLENAGQGCTTWTPFYHAGPAYVPSCDFWCLVSGEMARERILPTILAEMAPLERSVFHLDGPGALRHLDLLLHEMPTLNAVQWVFGAGQGPASRWVDIYKKVLANGKSVQVFAEGPEDAIETLKAVGKEGVWLCVEGSFPDEESAGSFIRDVERL